MSFLVRCDIMHQNDSIWPGNQVLFSSELARISNIWVFKEKNKLKIQIRKELIISKL
jgi:hypothetical protein